MLTATATVTPEEKAPTVSPLAPSELDRCDRCGSQAYLSAYKLGTEKLLFCGHHGKQHFASLTSQGFIIIDYTHILLEKEARFSTSNLH